MKKLPTITETQVWKHKTTGQKVSPYGACPWTREADRDQWELVPNGWAFVSPYDGTIYRNRFYATREEIEADLKEFAARG